MVALWFSQYHIRLVGAYEVVGGLPSATVQDEFCAE